MERTINDIVREAVETEEETCGCFHGCDGCIAQSDDECEHFLSAHRLFMFDV